MRFALSRSAGRCQVRRLAGVLGAAPIPAAVVGALLALAPLALARVGRTMGSELGSAALTHRFAVALVLGPALAAAVAGAVLALSLSGRAALGEQIAASPCGEVSAVVAPLLFPGIAVTVVVLPSLVALCVELVRALHGGTVSGLALAAAIVAAVPLGAAAAESAVRLVRRAEAWALVGSACLGAAWLACGAALGAAPAGPLGVVASGLDRSLPGSIGLAVSGVTAVCAGALWLALAASRPAPRTLRRSRPVSSRHGSRHPVAVAVVLLLVRRDDVRIGASATVGFGVLGLVGATVADAPAPSPFLLASTTALLGSILGSLAVCGALLPGCWLWRGGGQGLTRLGGLAALAGLSLTAVPVAAIGTGAWLVSGTSWSAAGAVGVLVVAGSACGLAAGAVVPWRRETLGDQVATFAAFAALAVAASITVGVVAPRLVALGVPGFVVGSLVCGGSFVVATPVVVRRLGAPVT